MSRLAPFCQADLVRALKAAAAAGLRVARVEIDAATGKIVITPTRHGRPEIDQDEGGNEWDEVLK
jgi:hypothetical protein